MAQSLFSDATVLAGIYMLAVAATWAFFRGSR